MKVFILRVFKDEERELRQIQNFEGFDKVVIDQCSGFIDLWDRSEAQKLKKLVDNGTIKHIDVNSIDKFRKRYSLSLKGTN